MTIYGMAELATAAGVKEKTMSAYVARGQCPAPWIKLACGPIWRDEDVTAWLESRDSRLERLVDEGDKVWNEEVEALASAVYVTNKSETAKRNVHNGKLTKAIARHERKHGAGSGVGLTLRGEGFVPTLKGEAYSYAESQLSVADEFSNPQLPAKMRRRNWAAELLNLRQCNRLGCEDGIPW